MSELASKPLRPASGEADAPHQRWTVVLASIRMLMTALDTLVVTTSLPVLRVSLHARRRSCTSRRSLRSPRAPVSSGCSLRLPLSASAGAHACAAPPGGRPDPPRCARSAARLDYQPDAALHQLTGVLPRSWHEQEFISRGPKSSFQGLR
jgi:hypothetical protein